MRVNNAVGASSRTSAAKKGPVTTVFLVVLALLLAACTGESVVDTTSGATDTTATDGTPPEVQYAVDSETVVIGRFGDVESLDLGMGVSFNDYHTLTNVYDGLTRRGADGAVEPSIATSWELVDDGLTWLIEVRQGVLFHNGEELTADDVAYSLNRLADPAFPGPMHADHYSNAINAEVTDDWTVAFHFSSPEPLFMHKSPTYTPIVPRSVAEPLGSEFAATPESAIGTGPYRLVSWEPDNQILLEAFTDHWRGEPSIRNVIIRPLSDPAARVAALRAGETDITEALPVEEVPALEDNDNYEARMASGTGRQRLVLNTNQPPFDSRENRLAVNLAIDTQGIISGVLDGLGEELAGYAVPGVEVGAHPELEPYGYDPDRARELLAEAGNPDGFTVDFLVNLSYVKAEEVAQAIAAQLAEVGIQTDLRAVEAEDFNRIQEEGTIEMGFTGHGGGGLFHVDLGLTAIFDCTRGSPVFSGYWCDDEYDAVLAGALDFLAQGDEEGAIAAYHEAQEILYEDVAFVPLYAQPFVFAVNRALIFDVTGDGGLWMYNASWGGDQ